MYNAAQVCVVDKSGGQSVVCKHVCKLGEVLTAATPRLEQRFDADLKEDRILQAQHGGSRKLSFTRRHKYYTAPVTFISTKNPNIPLLLKIYTSPPEHYPPQVRVRGSILKDSVCERLLRKETREVLPVCFLCHLVHRRVKRHWEKRRESIAWLVREVFHPGACCPVASPQSPSSHVSTEKSREAKDKTVRTFAPDKVETAAKQKS